jgi:hypothetical protein
MLTHHPILRSLALLLALTLALAAHAALTPALTPAELDLAQCAVFAGKTKLGEAPAGALTALLGLGGANAPARWTVERGTSGATVWHFRVVFTRPVAIGTICTQANGPRLQTLLERNFDSAVSYLKPGVAAPGEVAVEAQWVQLPRGTVKTLPAGTRTQALRFSYALHESQSTVGLGQSLLFVERLYSALAVGYHTAASPKDKPATWLGCWGDPLPIAGLVLLDRNTPAARLECPKPDAELPPTIAPSEQWKRVAAIPAGVLPVTIPFTPALSTNSLRLTTLQPQLTVAFPTVLPLVALGETALPPSDEPPASPFTFPYPMPFDGFMAINVVGPDGRDVRRLMAEVTREKGPVTERWDLKDNAGQFVAPGTYRWRGIARPPLKLTYEGTVNTAGQPAWWSPAPGKGGGGWMADHGAPISACAVGEQIFLGDGCAESGHAAIAVDRDGNKLWGIGHVLAGFAGADRIATDGRYAYLCNSFGVLRVDPQEGFKTRELLRFPYTRDLPSAGRWWDPVDGAGAVVRDRSLFVSFNAPSASWLQSALLPGHLDPAKSMPMPRLARGARGDTRRNKKYHEAEYDELQQYFAAFQTETMPDNTPSVPGIAVPSSTQAFYGDAPKDGALSGTLTVAFRTPVAIASVLVPDGACAVYALKPGGKLSYAEGGAAEPDADDEGGLESGEEKFDEATWTPLAMSTRAGRPALALAPAGGVETRALRFKTTRLLYALVLNRRFADLAPTAERVLGEGVATANGGWRVTRSPKTPLSAENPARMLLRWKTPVTVRGVSLSRPTTASMAFDVWTGPADADPAAALADDAAWKQVALVEGECYNGYFAQTATLRQVDFGAVYTTPAVRVRAIAPAGTIGPLMKRFPVNETHQAGFDALVAYSPLGDDPPLPPSLAQRITEIKLPETPEGKVEIVRHLPLAQPGHLAVDKAGTLFAVSAGQVVTVPLDGGASRVVVPKAALGQPSALTFDADGLLYVGDCGTKVVKVFNPATGALVRTLFTPGGQKVGAWDPARLDAPTGLAIDSAGKLWVVDNSYQPKRVMRCTRDGKPEKWFLGPTAYGGGGAMDPGDRSIIMYQGMKFRLDWTTRQWALESLLARPGQTTAGSVPERAVYLKGKRYLVGDAGGGGWGTTSVPMVYVERNGVAVPLACAGNLGAWGEATSRPELRAAFSSLQRFNYAFCWNDDNGDGLPQRAEVQLAPEVRTERDPRLLQPAYFRSQVGEDLSLNFAGARLRPVEIRPDGRPVYAIAKLEVVPLLTGESLTVADGRAYVMSAGFPGNGLLAPDGKSALWSYPDHNIGVHGTHGKGVGWDREPGKVVGSLTTVGHFTAGKEELFATNGNRGDWFVFTADGLLAGSLFGGPIGQPRRWWTMPEWAAGKTDLTGLNVGEEHFSGFVCTANDGKVYAIAGHNHNSIVRVDGFEAMQRVGGAVTVTAADLRAAQEWDLRRAASERRRQAPKVAKLLYLDNGVGVDGSLDDWDNSLFLTIADHYDYPNAKTVVDAEAALSYHNAKLFIAARATDSSQLQNSAEELTTLFKNGDALDISLGLDPAADPKRSGPVAGDLRLLITRVKGAPVAVLYRYGPGGEKPVHFTSPVANTVIDVVRVLGKDECEIELVIGERGWTLEAAIPWKALGVEAPPLGARLRGDVGLLESDENGMRTVGRHYWSGTAQTILSDLAAEARLSPSLWGDFYCLESDNSVLGGPDAELP